MVRRAYRRFWNFACASRCCNGIAYQRTVPCCCRPIAQKLMLLVETLITFPLRFALVSK